MPRFNCTIEFALETQFSPEISQHGWDEGDSVEFSDDSYFSEQPVECDGGSLEVVFNAEDEDEARDKCEDIVRDGQEIEDDNGITWVVSRIDVTIEQEETPLPSLSEALITLGEFAEEKREDEEWGEVARAAVVVIAEVYTLRDRVSTVEVEINALRLAIEELRTTPFGPQEEAPTEAA